MPAITIGVPASLTAPRPAYDYSCEATTVLEALRALVTDAPQFEPRIFYGERLLVVLRLNGKHLPPNEIEAARLGDGDRLDMLLPVAGG